MGKDYVKSVSKEFDNFIGCKYTLPKKVEEVTDRIRTNYNKFSVIYTLFAVLAFFIATLITKEFYAVFIAFLVFCCVSIIIGEVKPEVPIGDKKYKVKKYYAYIATIIITLAVAYYTKTMPTLTKTVGITLTLLTTHSIFAQISLIEKC
ncbi:hypothetical protein EIN_246890 [Entamoeba invadens IP1]|uniref:PRA1 family protein n=1 Tax=Entamoeba invadens IP1 TaxID=370355 RepID=A0A0A1UDX7_ENTIV|nr:hypothetical protein EIN_246890 [Entamoeba invadens IP1]ELP94795.1 hypothetical protein EIN_246890 [Entamoeba invadens IP1]|eukprot:XP_004261566.1 hypothetical protein EIN_246890 [Entamoeba invadens IP1]